MLFGVGVIAAGLFALFYPKKAQSGIFSQPKKYGPDLPLEGIPVNKTDLDTMARTIWAEARGEGSTGMQAVANVIMNRFRLAQQNSGRANQWGKTVAGICRKKYQFSCWLTNDPNYYRLTRVTDADPLFRDALNIARAALQYRLGDITGGATYYHTKAVAPKWSHNIQPVKIIGSHKFYTAAQVA